MPRSERLLVRTVWVVVGGRYLGRPERWPVRHASSRQHPCFLMTAAS